MGILIGKLSLSMRGRGCNEKREEIKKLENIEIQKEDSSPVVDTNIQKVVKEIKKLAKKDFAKLSAIAAVILSMGIWVTKGFWYTFYSGKFYVYKIDNCYIDTSSENVILQIIQVISVLIIIGVINYSYYRILVEDDKTKFHWKRKLKKFKFWTIEILFFTIFIILSLNVPLADFIKVIKLLDVIAILLVSILLCFMIKIYAIELAIEVKRKEKKKKLESNKEKDCETKKQNWIEDMLLLIVLTIAVEMLVVYVFAGRMEINRSGYKVIMSESQEPAEMPYDISCAGNKYQIYPIVFENQDCYIVTRLYYNDGEIEIDYNYQRIVEKCGQEIIYVENVYEISGDM